MTPDSQHSPDSEFSEDLCHPFEVLLILVSLLDISLELSECSLLESLSDILLVVSIEMEHQQFPEGHTQSQNSNDQLLSQACHTVS